MNTRDSFIEFFERDIRREGADELLAWLKTTDFFTAPASAKYHLNREGGLAEHSIHVYQRLRRLVEVDYVANPETIAICGLLHDVCKVDVYKIEMRNTKDEYGQWVKVPFYTADDQLPYGHGEKSVYIISAFMKLTRAEAMAIRWHMGGFDDAVKGGSYSCSSAFGKYPLAVLLHMADLGATFIDEAERAAEV